MEIGGSRGPDIRWFQGDIGIKAPNGCPRGWPCWTTMVRSGPLPGIHCRSGGRTGSRERWSYHPTLLYCALKMPFFQGLTRRPGATQKMEKFNRACSCSTTPVGSSRMRGGVWPARVTVASIVNYINLLLATYQKLGNRRNRNFFAVPGHMVACRDLKPVAIKICARCG